MRPGLREQHRAVALGVGPDAGGGLGALGSGLAGDALTLGLHPGQDRLSVLFGRSARRIRTSSTAIPKPRISSFT